MSGFLDLFKRLSATRRQSADLQVMEEELMIAFHDGVLEGVSNKVKKYLKSGGDPNMRSLFVHRLTLLHHAALEGLEDAVELLVMAGANVNANDGTGRSPLHAAVLSQNPAIVNILLQAEAKPNHHSLTRLAPIHLACVDGENDIVEALINARADINMATEVKWTALHFAAVHGHYALAKRLIDGGADYEAETGGGVAVLDLVGDEDARREIEALIIERKRQDKKLASR